MIGLVDCNNFYVSCERAFQPRLEGVPVGVMSNNDGCVIARSEELKALGVAMGTPAFELRPLVDRDRIRLLSSNYELYGDMSTRVREALEEFSAGVEPYSIDEMFVRFDGFDAATTRALARTLYRNVRRFTGIPVGVGVAPTRTLAKLANRAAKRQPGYDGVCVLAAEGDETRRLLERTALGDVWGVGRRLVERLGLQGIETAWDLRQADPGPLRRRFSVTLERTVRELQGLPCIELNDADEPRRRIMTSRSFGRLTGEPAELQDAIRQHAQRGAEKLRRQDSLARAVLVFLQTHPHRADLPQYSPSRIIELAEPTDDSRPILAAARQGLDAIYRRGYRFMKAGVMLLDLVDANRRQLPLLDTPEGAARRDRDHRLMATLDALNRRMGRGTVRLGVPRENAAWHLRCAHRTPRWTTRWGELPRVRT
ncbi:Y-family DNA polymerase [Halomonas beimenensis]|uniref:Error-prone, lesion bypass DNA polymerase V (UmuC) n=1 Tax=Halomonas beimenensis TaxID=475662 RepID=A0A291P8N6_9GAMM|nr:Y-family DNA polymerase [Halomonas beimenensis]ATJ83227.1 error-prone, lesion bypass DNA polymerase V (UmuC) [Halomonas beimenensis]